MRKLIYIALLFITNVAFGQADVIRTAPVTSTGANFNKQAVSDANLKVAQSFRLPRHPSNGLYGAKDTSGYVYWNTTVNKVIVYRGSSVWDTLNNNSGTLITQTQVIGLPDSLLKKINSADSAHYVTPYYAGQNFVPYTGAKFNVDLNGKSLNMSDGGQITFPDNDPTFHSSLAISRTGIELLGVGSINVRPFTGTYPLAGVSNISGHYARKTVDLYTELNGSELDIGQNNSTSPSFIHIGSETQTAGIQHNINFPFADGTVLLNNGSSTNVILADGTYAPYLTDYITTDGSQTGLTGNKATSGIWNTSGQWQANGGVTPDGMGAINNTMPNNSNNYAYYGMTRSGNAAVAMGMDNLNAIIFGTGPTRGNGATIDTILFRLNSHTGDLMLYGKLSVAGNTTFPNYYTTSGMPTGVLGSSTVVGSGATLTITGTNQDGEITLVTGTSVSGTGSAFTITMNGFAYPTKCTPIIMNEVDLGASGPRMTVNSLTGTTWTVSAGGNNFTSSSTYIWTYHNGGY